MARFRPITKFNWLLKIQNGWIISIRTFLQLRFCKDSYSFSLFNLQSAKLPEYLDPDKTLMAKTDNQIVISCLSTAETTRTFFTRRWRLWWRQRRWLMRVSLKTAKLRHRRTSPAAACSTKKNAALARPQIRKKTVQRAAAAKVQTAFNTCPACIKILRENVPASEKQAD